jgi:hypothetical protein
MENGGFRDVGKATWAGFAVKKTDTIKRDCKANCNALHNALHRLSEFCRALQFALHWQLARESESVNRFVGRVNRPKTGARHATAPRGMMLAS